MQIQPFSDDGGYTCLTNYVLDVVMPSLPPNAWKVLCFVIRKTRGWNKEKDRLSYSQIETGTGIRSEATICTALKLLIERKFLIASSGSAWKAMTYSLNSTLIIEVHESDSTSIIKATTEIEVHDSTSKFEVDSASNFEAPCTSNFEDTKETNLNKGKEKIRTPRKSAGVPAETSEHQNIMAAYADCLGYAIRDGPKEGNAAKWLVKNGYTADQVQACYAHLKVQSFWREKHVSLQTVASSIGAYLQSKNGHSNGNKHLRQSTSGDRERGVITETDLDRGF